jgi:hypothetical protein
MFEATRGGERRGDRKGQDSHKALLHARLHIGMRTHDCVRADAPRVVEKLKKERVTAFSDQMSACYLPRSVATGPSTLLGNCLSAN